MQLLLEHHDSLRLRFERRETGWRQYIASPDRAASVTRFDLSKLSTAEQGKAISEAADELQSSLNLESGPLIQVAYFDLGAHKSDRLLLIIHHLAVDGVSWRILLEDLQIAQQQLSQGKTPQLPPKTTSFQYWATQLSNYGQSEALQQEINHWLEHSSAMPIDFPKGNNTLANADTVSVGLTKVETQALLQEVPTAYKTQINDVLLTAVVQAFGQWTGTYGLLIDLEGHGREDLFEDVDLSRTVGWFTTLFPVALSVEQSNGPGEALKTVKEQLRAIPHRGIGYGVLRYLSNQDTMQQQRANIRFNYLGQIDQALQQSSLFTPATESMGAERSLNGNRYYAIDINGIIADGQLSVNWTYSQTMYRQTTIETLANYFIEALRSLITHCQSPDAGGYTPSDFSEASLNQQELDRFLAKLKGKS